MMKCFNAAVFIGALVALMQPRVACVSAQAVSQTVKQIRVLSKSNDQNQGSGIIKHCGSVSEKNLGSLSSTLTRLSSSDAAVRPLIQKIASAPTANEYFLQGVTNYNKQDYQGALADYNQALRLNPEEAKAYYNRGIVRDELGDKQGALADFQQAETLAQQQGNAKLYEAAQKAIKSLQQ